MRYACYAPESYAMLLYTSCAEKGHLMSHATSIMPLGYTIPTIDLADQTHRQIIVDKEEGQYLGHVSTVLLEDQQTIIAVYPKGHGNGAVVMKKSSDTGLTWSERLEVPKNWTTSKEVPTIHRVVDQQGVKRLILFSGLYPIRMAVSENNGITWSQLEAIGDFGGIVAMGDVIRLQNGNYMAFFHDDGRFLDPQNQAEQTRFDVYKITSKDGGLTWCQPTIATHHPVAHLCEPGLVRSPNGNQLAMLLRENSRQFNSFAAFSVDEGEHWSEPIELPASLTGDRHTCCYAKDGRLVIVFRDTTRDSPTHGGWVAWIGKYHDIVNREEGQYRIRLMDNKKGSDCCYPGVECLTDGTIVTTTYGHWIENESPFIVSVRFKLEEIDTLAQNT